MCEFGLRSSVDLSVRYKLHSLVVLSDASFCFFCSFSVMYVLWIIFMPDR